MSEYQITYWRELPSLVVARDAGDVVKAPLAPRFQEAIDSAAMTLGAVDSDAYLAGWQRAPWVSAEGSPGKVCEEVAARLEAEWPPEALASFLSSLEAEGGSPA
ncbi:MAG: virulence factor [Nocardioidaceae bacterium]|nr:virulence factor [Nocardioidaceae bacterium]